MYARVWIRDTRLCVYRFRALFLVNHRRKSIFAGPSRTRTTVLNTYSDVRIFERAKGSTYIIRGYKKYNTQGHNAKIKLICLALAVVNFHRRSDVLYYVFMRTCLYINAHVQTRFTIT